MALTVRPSSILCKLTQLTFCSGISEARVLTIRCSSPVGVLLTVASFMFCCRGDCFYVFMLTYDLPKSKVF